MNFENLNMNQDWVQSKTQKAIEYSKNADIIGNNYKQVYNDHNKLSSREKRYQQKHKMTQEEYDREFYRYENLKSQLREYFGIIDKNGDGQV